MQVQDIALHVQGALYASELKHPPSYLWSVTAQIDGTAACSIDQWTSLRRMFIKQSGCVTLQGRLAAPDVLQSISAEPLLVLLGCAW